MKNTSRILFVAFLLCAFSMASNAQFVVPKGKVLLLEFTNQNAKFTVPAGKAWYVSNVFVSDGMTNNFVFLKRINDQELTSDNVFDLNMLLYSTDEEKKAKFSFPIAFPSDTNFEFVILKYGFLAYESSKAKAFVNIIEVDNQ